MIINQSINQSINFNQLTPLIAFLYIKTCENLENFKNKKCLTNDYFPLPLNLKYKQ